MQKILFLDTETTGNEPSKDRLCQVCWAADGVYHTEFFKPPIPISIKSMSITHITNKMVADKPAFEDSTFKKELQQKLTDHILVAHNARFDIAMLEAEGVSVPRHICTLRVARHLDRDNKIPEYGLQFLRYFLDLEVEGFAHDAEGDVRVLIALFDRLYAKVKASGTYTYDDDVLNAMIDMSLKPILFTIMPFGKYKDTRIDSIAHNDPNYLKWLLQQKLSDGEQDEDWIYTLKTHVGVK
jgi:DNA polymerase III epsilon subunit-like protein